MNGRVRRYLINLSRHQTGSVSYITLVHEAELGFNLDISHEKARLNEMLSEISESEYAAGRPLLSALITIKGSKGQGDNFFKMCERLGMGPWRSLKQDPDFVDNLRRECRDFWRDEANFAQFS